MTNPAGPVPEAPGQAAGKLKLYDSPAWQEEARAMTDAIMDIRRLAHQIREAKSGVAELYAEKSQELAARVAREIG